MSPQDEEFAQYDPAVKRGALLVAWPPAWPWVASSSLRAELLAALSDEQLDAALRGDPPDEQQASACRSAQAAAPLGDSVVPWADPDAWPPGGRHDAEPLSDVQRSADERAVARLRALACGPASPSPDAPPDA